MHTCTHAQQPGEPQGGQGSPPCGIREARGDSIPERLGPGHPHSWAGTCRGLYRWSGLQRALNPTPPHRPVSGPPADAHHPGCGAFGLSGCSGSGQMGMSISCQGGRVRGPWMPLGEMWVGLDPTAPSPRWQGHPSPGSQREGPFLQDCGLRGPHVTALGLPGQGQNQLSLPEAPEMHESRGGHLDGYLGRLVTSEGWAVGRQAPSLGGSLLSRVGWPVN